METFINFTYLQKNYFLYRLDARLKFLLFLITGALVFILTTITTLVLLAIFLFIYFIFARISVRYLFRLFLTTIIFLGISYGFYSLTPITNSLYLSTLVALRIYLILFSGLLLMKTVSELELARAITWLLTPLKIIKVPINEIGLMLSLAIRFIPLLLFDIKVLLTALETKNLSYRSGNIFNRFRAFSTIFLPLFIISFQRADDLSKTLYSRGYQINGKRSNYYQKSFSISDYSFFILGVICLMLPLLLMIIYPLFIPLDFGR